MLRHRKVQHLRDTEQLCSGKHLRRFVMVAADLFHTFRQSIPLVSGFGLHHCHRNPVNQKHDIGAVAVYYPLLRPFIGHMKPVIVRVIVINQRDISIAIFIRDENRLAPRAAKRERLGFPQALV